MEVRITEKNVQYRSTFKQIMDIGLKLMNVPDPDDKISDKIVKDNNWTEVQLNKIINKIKFPATDTKDDLEIFNQSIKLESKKHNVMMKPQ